MALKSGEIARVNHVFQLTVKYILEKPWTGARETNQGARVVKNQISLWYKSGRNVTMENFFMEKFSFGCGTAPPKDGIGRNIAKQQSRYSTRNEKES